MSTKPVIYAANVSEFDLKDGNDYTKKVQEYASSHGAEMVIISARIEEELAELSPDEAKEYLHDLGVEDSGINRMIKSGIQIIKFKNIYYCRRKRSSRLDYSCRC